jgi:hypothetical protein
MRMKYGEVWSVGLVSMVGQGGAWLHPRRSLAGGAAITVRSGRRVEWTNAVDRRHVGRHDGHDLDDWLEASKLLSAP